MSLHGMADDALDIPVPSSGAHPPASMQPDVALVSAAVSTLCFLLIVWVLLVLIAPYYWAYYNEFSGGEAQFAPLTDAVFAASHWMQASWWWALPLLGIALVALCYPARRLGRWAFILLLTLLTVTLATLAWVGLYALPRVTLTGGMTDWSLLWSQ